ncbi:MAG: hypothetical protein ACLGIE_17045 [Alphaproteobacteria bacterium]
MNREQRRRLAAKAPALARLAAACSFDSGKTGLHPVDRPKAMAALQRAFERMLRAGGKPMAFPLSEAEAEAFPAYRALPVPGAVHALAVGLDVEGRGAYALQSAAGEHKAQAHEVARTLALARLAEVCALPGFPEVAKGGVA